MIRPKTLLLSLVGGGAGVICALVLSAGTAHAATPPTSQVGGVNANAPVSVSDIAVGVVGGATTSPPPSNGPSAAPSGGTATVPHGGSSTDPPGGSGSAPSSTTQQVGGVNANAPVSVSDIAVGVVGGATTSPPPSNGPSAAPSGGTATPPHGGSSTDPPGGSGSAPSSTTQQVGGVNANAPVSVSDIAVGVVGGATTSPPPSNRPSAAPSGGTATPSTTTQQLSLVNANAPVNVCGIAVGALGCVVRVRRGWSDDPARWSGERQRTGQRLRRCRWRAGPWHFGVPRRVARPPSRVV